MTPPPIIADGAQVGIPPLVGSILLPAVLVAGSLDGAGSTVRDGVRPPVTASSAMSASLAGSGSVTCPSVSVSKRWVPKRLIGGACSGARGACSSTRPGCS